MCKTVFFALLLLLPLAAADDVNSDANAVDANVSDANLVVDENVFAGPITLMISFEHQVIGGKDFNASGWLFTKDEDFSFEVDVPSLDKFYFLDFVEKEAYVYEGSVQSGWHPMLSTETDFSFTVRNLLGSAQPSVFLLWFNDVETAFEHLEPGEVTTVVVSRPTHYYLLVDADKYGLANFGLDVGPFELGVSVNFRVMPEAWEWVEKHGVACEDNPSHICILFPDGSTWDYSACIDKDSELNREVGEAPSSEICIGGKGKHNEWFVARLVELKNAEAARADTAEDKSPEEVVGRLGQLEKKVDTLGTSLSASDEDESSRNAIVWFAIGVVGCVFAGALLYNRQDMPNRVFSLRKRLEEVVENVRQKERKEEGEGSGGASAAEGDRARGAERVAAEIREWW
jgi:hypothetical protein